jgi:signal transduction histidine kinase
MRDWVTVRSDGEGAGSRARDLGPAARRRLPGGLASRVVILIFAFVTATVVAIYIPFVTNYRDNWFRNRLSAAYTATLVLESAPRDMVAKDAMVPNPLSTQLLEAVGARIIVLRMHGTRRIVAAAELPAEVDEIYDLRHPMFPQAFASAIRTFFGPPGRVVMILGDAPMGGEAIEVTLDEAPLKAALHGYAERILFISLAISVIVAGLVVTALHIMVLRPVRRLTTNLIEFGADPENSAHIIVPSGHSHEIGRAEQALATMEETLARELKQKKHLAALGLAVAKINHDMRNMLSSAQLLSDRLAGISDPLAQRLAPKLVATLDRAIRFCQATLTYGRAADDPPKPRLVALRAIVDEAAETVVLGGHTRVEVGNEVPEDFEIWADGEQMFRVLMNLIRNGVEALDRAGPAPGRLARVEIKAWHEARNSVIEIQDTGPGVPIAVRSRLFSPFLNSTRPGGSGLGLAIAADLVRAHGGNIILVSEAEDEKAGATFQIQLPLRPANGQR